MFSSRLACNLQFSHCSQIHVYIVHIYRCVHVKRHACTVIALITHENAQKKHWRSQKRRICLMSCPASHCTLKTCRRSTAAAQKAGLLDEPRTARNCIVNAQKGAEEALLQPEQDIIMNTCAANRGRTPSPTALQQQNLHRQCP